MLSFSRGILKGLECVKNGLFMGNALNILLHDNIVPHLFGS
jgi:hypothetical protein